MSDKKVYYVSGPMTGIEDFNYPAFQKVTAWLRGKGHSVICPTEAFDGDKTKNWREYMKYHLSNLARVEVLVLLPGWNKSKGSLLEALIASFLNSRIQQAKFGNPAAFPDDAPIILWETYDQEFQYDLWCGIVDKLIPMETLKDIIQKVTLFISELSLTALKTEAQPQPTENENIRDLIRTCALEFKHGNSNSQMWSQRQLLDAIRKLEV